IAKWLRLQDVQTLPSAGTVPYLSGFQFAEGAAFSERFKVAVTVSQPQDNMITVGIDAFVPVINVAAPAGTISMELIIAVAGCTLATGAPTASETQHLKIPYNKNKVAAQALQFNIPTTSGCLIVTAAWLQYYVLKNSLVSRTEKAAFIPAGVINARYS
ncbi:MAG: hypothetical protein M3Y85_06665, partial [Bacteroidota bacterium]|nr:hypothetical protein [Bacteroidota bacterium]